jgi:hypothetical protein
MGAMGAQKRRAAPLFVMALLVAALMLASHWSNISRWEWLGGSGRWSFQYDLVMTTGYR